MKIQATSRPSAPSREENAPFYDGQLFARLWRFVRPHARLFFASLALLPLAAALQLLPPYLLKLAIDHAIIAGALERLAPYALALIATLLLQNVAGFGQQLLVQLCGQRAMHDLRLAVHRHILALRVSYFDRTPVGRVMTRVTNDVESIAEAFSSGLVSVVGDLLTLIGIVVAMLLLDLRLALLTSSVLPALLLLVWIFQRALRRAYRLIRQRLALINATLQEQLGGVKVVQIFAREQRATEDFDRVNGAFRDAYRGSIRLDSALFALVEMLGSLTVALLLWYGGGQVAGGTVTFGLLVAFIEYARRFFIPVRDLSAKYAVMQQAMAAAERVFELLDTDEPDCPAAAAAAPAASPEPKVAFEAVSFGYEGRDELVIEDMTFAVQPGEHVAVVGATGAGKSTLARLLTRLYERQQGTVRLDGLDVRAIDPAQLRRRVVVLSQDVYLFAGTVGSNIILDDATVSVERAQQAAERVGLARLLALDHPVLERGANLSAGQRQLVVFARALARDPEVLVLDEATANVDPASEQIVQDGIAELMRARTAIVIAHRLSTIERADRVLVLAAGRLVEQGRHEELLAQRGIYARLYELQRVSAG